MPKTNKTLNVYVVGHTDSTGEPAYNLELSRKRAQAVVDKLISDHQQSWGYEDGPWKGPELLLLVAADLIHKPPASIRFAPIKHALAVTVEPFKFSSRQGGVAYELS